MSTRQIGTEEHRHRCLVRHFLRLRAEQGPVASETLDAWEAKARGPGELERVSRLRRDCCDQWKLGNRGLTGDWRAADVAPTEA